MEIWKPIPATHGLYEASSTGRIRSLDRQAVCGRRGLSIIKGRVLSPKTAKNGYLQVSLSCDGQKTMAYVHRLVASAFLSGFSGREINHKDLDKTNNRPANLEECDHRSNQQHAALHGRCNGTTNPRKRIKMTPETVAALRAAHAAGATYSQLAQQFGISHQTAGQIVREERWQPLASSV